MKYINYSKELNKITLPRYNSNFEKETEKELERNGFFNPNLISKIVVINTENLIKKTSLKLSQEQVDINESSTLTTTNNNDIETATNLII